MTPQGLGTWIVIGVMVLTMGTSFAFEEPEGFKEAKFGDSEQAVRGKLNIPAPTYSPPFAAGGRVLLPGRTFDLSCHSVEQEYRTQLGHRFCNQGATIGDIPVGVRYTFRDDKLVDISFSFEVVAYPEMALAFLSRFGKPSERDEHIVTTGRGVEYLNEALTWSGPVVVIFLSKYAATVTSSSARYRLVSEYAAVDELRREQGAKGAKDLK
jgi:hypothetical protein